MTELEALVLLSGIPQIGAIKLHLLLQRFGTALNALNAPHQQIGELPGFGPKVMEEWSVRRNNDAWKRELELVDKMGVKLIPYSDPQYPKRLRDIADKPVLLYIMGDIRPIDQSGIAIVGTRHAGIYGMEMAEKIAARLAERKVTVVSGLARGIDTAAHQGVLKNNGRTLAVIGSGLADIYPRENANLAKAIEAGGALISEFPMTTPPDRPNFPQRNRIVSGMTMGTVLIEAPEKSGAMITMNLALNQGRRLFALPGRADSDNFRGNHALIKKGKAQLIENADDILGSFEDLFCTTVSQLPLKKKLRPALEKEEEELLKHLVHEEISFDELIRRTKLPVMKLNVLLMSLLLKSVIKEFPGKIYKAL